MLSLTQKFVEIGTEDKMDVLVRTLEKDNNMEQTIIFCNSIPSCRAVELTLLGKSMLFAFFRFYMQTTLLLDIMVMYHLQLELLTGRNFFRANVRFLLQLIWVLVAWIQVL